MTAETGNVVKLHPNVHAPATRRVVVELDFLEAFEILNSLLLRRERLAELHRSVLDPESPVIEAALARIESAERAVRLAAGLGDLP